METDTIYYAGGVKKIVEVIQKWEAEEPSPYNRTRKVKVRCRRVRTLSVELPPVGTIGGPDERLRKLWSNPAHIGKEHNEKFRPATRDHQGGWFSDDLLKAPTA